MAAASGLSETMTLDDDSGAHEGNDEDNGDDAYGIESHGEQDAIARQVQLLDFIVSLTVIHIPAIDRRANHARTIPSTR